MKKVLFALSLLPILAGFARADESKFKIPYDRDNAQAITVQETGVYVLCSSFNATTAGVQGIVAVYGAILSTAPTSSGVSGFMHIWSTGTDNFSAIRADLIEEMVPPIAASSATFNTLVVFNPPIISTSGFAFYVDTPAVNGAVFYRYLSTGNYEDVWFPTDDNGEKTHDANFYGVSPSSESLPSGLVDNKGTESLDFNSNNIIVHGSSLTTPAKYLWYGFMAGTATTGNFMAVYDSATITSGITPAPYLPNLMYKLLPENSKVTGGGSYTTVYYWPWPLILRNGMRIVRTFPTSGSPDRFRIFGRSARRLRY